MMDSCLINNVRTGPVVVDDGLRRDLSSDFAAVPSTSTQSALLPEKEHMQVYLRIRPFTAAEVESEESQGCYTMEPPSTVILKAPRSSLSARHSEMPFTQTKFEFSQVYGPQTTQREMFDGTVKNLVRDVLGGGNSVVFTYGVTNAGKTFTFLGPDSDGGLLPRSLNVIFNSIEGRVFTENVLKPHRCRDFTRLTPAQQEEEASSKKSLLRQLKEPQSETQRSNFTGSSLNMSDASVDGSFCLDVDTHTKFSVWVSFCEIYNENIHDLLETLPHGVPRRAVLRISQDIKGNSFVKDLKWVQVNTAEEAYRVMKIGKKNQSLSSTKLNHLSSRSHSIFAIRILKISNVSELPRVDTISELSLCDLAGSERCAKTQNRGDRLKEAGNINTSLLTLGKCIHALRLQNQQNKFPQHVPYRESKLTHYLQGFFCGRGKACMIVNISQCASMYDETLNVLKFSAVAQKVMVVVHPKPVPMVAPKRSAREVSLIIDNANRPSLWERRKSSLGVWETTLEDVQEDDLDDEEEEDEEEASREESMAEETVLEAEEEDTTALEEDLDQTAEDALALESRIRQEVSLEFAALFEKMEEDYKDRLQKERDILEKQADKRLEILRSCASATPHRDSTLHPDSTLLEAEQVEQLSEELSHMQQQLNLKAKELEQATVEKRQIEDQLQETEQTLEKQAEKLQQFMEMCEQKDTMISKLQATMDRTVEEATRNRSLVESIQLEILELQSHACACTKKDCGGQESRRDDDEGMGRSHGRDTESRKRPAEDLDELDGLPPLKRGLVEEESLSAAQEELRRLQEECDQKNRTIFQLQTHLETLEKRLSTMEEERRADMEEAEKKKKISEEEATGRSSLEAELRQTVERLTSDLEIQMEECELLATSLEREKKNKDRMSQENKALINGIFQERISTEKVGSEVTALQAELRLQTETANRFSEELNASGELRKVLEDQLEKKTSTIETLTQEMTGLSQEVERLNQEVGRLGRESEELKVSSEQEKTAVSGFHSTIANLQAELRLQTDTTNRLSEELSASNTLREDLEDQLEKKTRSVKALTQEVAAGNTEVVRLNQEVERLNQEVGRLEQQGEELKAQETIAARVACEAAAAQAEQQVAQTERQVTNLEERLAQSDRRVADLEQNEQRLHQIQTETLHEMGLLKEQLLGLEAQLQGEDELVLQIGARVSQCGALQEELEQAQGELEQAQGELARINRQGEEERNRENERIQASELQLADMRKALSEQEKTQEEQEKALEARMKEIEALTQELTSLRESHLQNSQSREKICTASDGLSGGEKDRREDDDDDEWDDDDEQERSCLVEGLKEELRKFEQRKLLEEQLLLPTPEVLDSSQVSRFPRPEVEIQFSPLRPNTLNLRKQGDAHSTTVKITKSKRKRKSCEMTKSSPSVLGVRFDNNKLPTPTGLKAKTDGTLLKIGEFIHSSPSLLGSKAKTIMGMVSGRSAEKAKPTASKPKRTKRKLYTTDMISSPLNVPSPFVEDQEEKESAHLIIKRRLRSRSSKK